MDGEVCTPLYPQSSSYTIQAAVFGYFELLLHTADVATVVAEKGRIADFKQSFKHFGTPEDIYEVFTDETESVFDRIIEGVSIGERDEAFLTDIFNIPNTSDSVIFHFRVGFTQVDSKSANIA